MSAACLSLRLIDVLLPHYLEMIHFTFATIQVIGSPSVVRPAADRSSSLERRVGLVDIRRSDQELGSADRRVHAAGIVSPNHRLDPGLVQHALGYLSIRGRREC
jgi:hypothetical protein